ncbi:MAG: rod shape-determining protein RodA, rod shape determining protein RodA [Candidatus Parcubacteria bacterium]|jgi:rod shape determining protein RodA
MLRTLFSGFDIPLFAAALLISLFGLATMYSYVGGEEYFVRQVVWISVSTVFLIVASIPDYRLLRNGNTVFYFYLGILFLLALILVIGEVTLGAQSRFDLGFFSFQPSDPAKLVLIMVLAKYFSKRHVEIGDLRHVIVSGIYAFLIFALVFVQPDFGSGIILASIWFGLVLVAGISWKHLGTVVILAGVVFSGLWLFGFEEYQKERIMTFLHPLADIRGAGYNAYQSTIAVGSGQLLGKGVGYGTQSKLQFLPEYETDFIFAAFAEEWGFVGVIFLFFLYGVVIMRTLRISLRAETNFERIFGAGVAILFTSHFLVHIGMNIGLMPVTGTTVPFLSYGGSHLITEFLAIGILMGMNKTPSERRTRRVDETILPTG